MAKIYMIAGEASGDLHGSNLVKAIKNMAPSTDIRCWGGDLMEAAGAKVVKHFRDLAFMGFAEVVMNLRTILRNIAFCKEDILQYRPDVLVLIDYPGFNLRIAEWAKKQGLKVVYYVAPQVWAWKPNRVKMMKQCIDKQLVILPFEEKWFKDNWQWDVTYVGHPLTDAVEQFTPTMPSFSKKPIVAILPGSRKQEIKTKLPVMLQMASRFPDHQFIVAMAPGLPEDFYKPFLQKHPNTSAVKGLTYELLSQAKAALVTSGTATLETALFGVPEVVCYKGNPISYQIAKRLIKVPYISLVNLIMEKQVVKELIQDEMNENTLYKELNLLLNNNDYTNTMKMQYTLLRNMLTQKGSASQSAAKEILQML
ncbi:MAG: lipid-A-disaccharide synthase [Chitinophagaceae bacterium]|nr:lipid-A-disaccharide synthase [Chitinophagaceae bacterium]